MKKAIVIGASSGIGRALAKIIAADGYTVGVAARKLPLLLELQKEIGSQTFVRQIDISDPAEAMSRLSELIQEMGGVDLIVISAGTGFINPELEWDKEDQTIAVNVSGFAALANVAMHHFLQKGAGHLVNISSLAAIRGNRSAPAYNASKAFESNYTDGLRQRVTKLRLPIAITDIQPGFVDTAMAQGEGLFWIAPLEKAAKQIYQAIKAKKKRAYVTKRWRLIAWFFRFVPDFIYDRL
ncbi:MAG TPA: SDR family NAD(P)-dependent oxidoreductase [Anaerolineales bacterium]|nr:SDR family NAD(P)-dependent oxidoreductase [Anaerolineales bacterium]